MYGAGDNSTALLVHMATKKMEPPDLILFADTGGEKPGTYSFIPIFSAWLVDHRFPPVTIVTAMKDGEPYTLEAHSLATKKMPSKAYGKSSCSIKFKREPQDAFVEQWPLALHAWANGNQVTKLMGFHAHEPRRSFRFFDDWQYRYRHPLIEWGWGPDQCVRAILDAGLPRPGKSSCFYCPSSKRHEVLALPDDLRMRAVIMEDNARPFRGVTKGLGAANFNWKRLIVFNDTQGDLFDDLDDETCSACSDGEEG